MLVPHLASYRNLNDSPGESNPYEPSQLPAKPDDEQDLVGDSVPQPPVAWFRDRSFWGMTFTQFLGAFNDNVFKQTLLLLFVAVPAYWSYDPAMESTLGRLEKVDLQGMGTVIFAAPFVLFSGYAGYLSDRYGKRRVIFLCKVAEVLIMAVGCLAFLALARFHLSYSTFTMFAVLLFAMGSHSAFFGPGKYGILPELFRERDLPAINGVIIMSTFLAIILGSALAGTLVEFVPDRLWVVGLVCVGIAVAGVYTASLVRPTPPVDPNLKFEISMLAIPGEMWKLLKSDFDLHATVWASTLFWHAAAVVQMTVNSFGKEQLKVGDRYTSLLVATLSIGIAAGSLLAGMISKGRFHTGVLRVGVGGMAATLALMALPGSYSGSLFSYGQSFVVLNFLGIFTGMFAVPVQVYLQMKPPPALKGRMIATQNLMNWIGILVGGALYQVLVNSFASLGLPPSRIFAVTAVMMGLTTLLYWPREQHWAKEA